MDNFFAKNIKYIREKRNLSKSEFARKLNVSQSTVTRWENKEMGITIDNAIDISNLLNIPLQELLGNDLRTNSNNDKRAIYINGIKIEYALDRELTDEDKMLIIKSIMEEENKQD